MTADAIIKAALAALGPPVENGVYHGSAEQYYTFKISTRGFDFSDDAPAHELALVQVHYFAPLKTKFSERRAQTKRALYDAGCTWPTVEDASDDSVRHIVFECELLVEA